MLDQLFKDKRKILYGAIFILIILSSTYYVYQYVLLNIINTREGLTDPEPVPDNTPVPDKDSSVEVIPAYTKQKSNTISPVQSNSSVGPPTSGEPIEQEVNNLDIVNEHFTGGHGNGPTLYNF